MGGAGGAISKAALKHVPREALKWNIWVTCIWASYCGGLHGFNTANISGAMSQDSFVRDFGWANKSDLDISNLEGWAVSSMLLGQTLGILLSGPLGERRGRKIVILTAAVFYSIGAILMSANFGSYGQLIAGRVLSGLGSGFGMTVGTIYIAEVAPKELRGCMTTFYNINIMSGVAASYWINYGSYKQIPASSSWTWRTTMVLQLIPAIALFIGWPFFPESPRYLMIRGQASQAKAAMKRLRNLSESSPYFTAEWNELKHKVDADAETSATGWQSLQLLMRDCVKDESTRKRLLFVLLIQTFFIMSGGNSITYYAPTILSSIGLNPEQILLFSGVYGLIKVLSVLLYAFALTDRWGRRPLLLIGSAINVCCLTYLAAFLGTAQIDSSSDSGGGAASPAAWVAIVAICFFAIGYGFGWAPAFSLTASEICPTHTRGTIVTLAFTYQNLLNFGISRGFPNMTVSMQVWGPFALFAAFTAVATGWVYLAFPECKGRSMESMDALFQIAWWRVGRCQEAVEGDSVEGSEGRGEKWDLEKEGVTVCLEDLREGEVMGRVTRAIDECSSKHLPPMMLRSSISLQS